MAASIILLRGIIAELERRGVQRQHAIEHLAISPELLANADARVSNLEIERVLLRAKTQTDGEPIGLSVGLHAPKHMLHAVAGMMMAADTLRQAMASLERYSPLLLDDLRCQLTEEGATAELTFQAPLQFNATRRFVAELVCSMVVRIAKYFVPTLDAAALRIAFEHQDESHLESYREAWSPHVRVGQPANSLSLRSQLLDLPQPYAEPMIFFAMREVADRRLRVTRENMTMAERVKDALTHEPELGALGVSELASAMGMTARVLRSRLAREGVSLLELLNDERQRSACTSLRLGRSVREIAEEIGFANPSAFHRAFKRWTGHTPGEYLKQMSAQLAR